MQPQASRAPKIVPYHSILLASKSTLWLTKNSHFPQCLTNPRGFFQHRAEPRVSLPTNHSCRPITHPNSFHPSSIALLVSRFAASPSACRHLTADIFSRSSDVRDLAKHVLELFDTYSPPPSTLLTHNNKPLILDLDWVLNLRDNSKTDETTQAMCLAFSAAYDRVNQGIFNYRQVAEAVEWALLNPSSLAESRVLRLTSDGHPTVIVGLDQSLDRRIESLDHRVIASVRGSSTPPVRVPTAALSAILQSGVVGRRSETHATTSRRFPEESPEEAEVRRRRNRAARVMEVAEEYVIV